MRWRLVFLIPVFAPPSLFGSEQCSDLTAPAQQRLKSYVAKQFRLLPGTPVSVSSDEVQAGCYRKVTLAGGGMRIVLYVAPDQRFVAPSISDTEMDPVATLKSEDLRIARVLLSDPSLARRGRSDAPVTLVEFADFQCPYCRDLDNWIKSLPPDLARETRTVYKFFPLSIHPWAQAAATVAACAELQSQDAFWALHDFFYREQDRLTAGLVPERAAGALGDRLGPKLPEYRACLAGHLADHLVDRDVTRPVFARKRYSQGFH